MAATQREIAMRKVAITAISTIILVSSALFQIPAGAKDFGHSAPAGYSSPRPTTGASFHGSSRALPQAKMTAKGCFRNCMRGGMRGDFCQYSCGYLGGH